ncbi:MAG: TIGR02646 family protein [Planctomycetota bacterium]|nr:TIGR02646 family protein [Planctomycetota bacterium]
MHRLDRSAVLAPKCLDSYRHGANTWSDVTEEHRQQIRGQLEQLQGRRCAYCEASLDQLGQHIEHFRRRSQFPRLTFEWTNLLWSCDSSQHCGHYKDQGAGPYDPDELIDPCVDDPDRYFQFHSDGSIRLRLGLKPHEKSRAEESLRVYNLDSTRGPLRHMRMSMCAGYVQIGAELADFAQNVGPDEWRQYLELELASTRELPFCTAIRHTLGGGG